MDEILETTKELTKTFPKFDRKTFLTIIKHRIYHLPLMQFMQQSLQIGKTQWICVQEPNKEIINQLAQEYGFHEVIVDDLIEINAQSKIDSNSKHFFLALTFTKYLENDQRYLFNELDVIIGDNYIITTNSLESKSINDLFEAFKNQADPVE